MGNSRKLGELGIAIDSSATTTAITIDASENVGIGITPEAWRSTSIAIEVGGGASLESFTTEGVSNHCTLISNAYHDGVSWKYKITDEASRYTQSGGIHTFDTVASGTADTAITWTTALTIDNSANATFGGNVSLSAGKELNLNRTTDDDGFINFQATIDADATSAISSFTTSSATTHHIQILLNGTPAWIAVSTIDPTA